MPYYSRLYMICILLLTKALMPVLAVVHLPLAPREALPKCSLHQSPTRKNRLEAQCGSCRMWELCVATVAVSSSSFVFNDLCVPECLLIRAGRRQ